MPDHRDALAQRFGERSVANLEKAVGFCDDIHAMIVIQGREAFLADKRSQWAAEMGLIRIGETVNRLPAELLEAYPGQPWRVIVAMRNFAAHQYDDLNPARVWTTVAEHIPSLRAYLSHEVLGD